jgi:hypothetical protein
VLTLNAYIAPFVSRNLEGRKHVLGGKIGDLHPDIVALQEIWNEDDAEDVARALADVGLPHVKWVARPGRPPFGSSGLMTASRYPLENIRFGRYEAGAVPPVLFHADWTAGKGVLTTRAMTPFGPVEVANTHVHAGYDLYDYPAVRLMQLVELTQMLWDRTPPGEPLIVAGDLNSRPKSLPVRFLERAGALRLVSDALDIDLILTRDAPRMHLYPRETRKVLTEPVTLEDGVVDALSDHPGVLTVFEVRTGGGPASGVAGARALVAEARRSLSEHITSLRRLRWLFGGLALLCGLGMAVLWRRFHRTPARGAGSLALRRSAYVALAVPLVWSGYLASVYATAHLRDIARSLDRLALLERSLR